MIDTNEIMHVLLDHVASAQLNRYRFFSVAGTPRRANALILAVLLCLLGGRVEANAQTIPPPDVVKVPAGLNLGGSSFYDGFGSTEPGWTFIDVPRWNHFTSIKDNDGNNSPLFVNPRIDAFSNLFHLIDVLPIHMPGGALAVEVLLPVVGFDTRFDAPGTVLQDHGWGIGDLTFGADYQAQPTPLGKESLLCWRFGLDFIASTGAFDATKDLNPGSGFWSITPYLAASVLPVPKWEISSRLTYDYNFSTTRGADPPPLPGFTFHDGQAGQALVINFASSYAVSAGIRPGINGYWLAQITDDRSNGHIVPSARANSLYLGPGVFWQVSPKSIVDFNIYLPVDVKNGPSGPQFNIQTIIQF